MKTVDPIALKNDVCDRIDSIVVVIAGNFCDKSVRNGKSSEKKYWRKKVKTTKPTIKSIPNSRAKIICVFFP